MFERWRHPLRYLSVWAPGDLCWVETKTVIGNTTVRAGVVEAVKAEDDKILVVLADKIGEQRCVVDSSVLWRRE